MKISYAKVKDLDIKRIKEIYESCGWKAYLNDDSKLESAFLHSLFTYGAYLGEELVGFVRCVGDGEHVVLVQDLIVHSDYQKKGIGTALFQYVMKKYVDVRMVFVVTDLYDELDNRFYQTNGLHKLEKKQMVAYIR